MGQLFNDALTAVINGNIDFLNDDIVACLFLDAPDIDADTFLSDLTGELSGGGYVRKTLASKTVTTDDTNNRSIADAADVQWTGLTGTFGYIVTAKSTGNDATSRCLSVIPLGGNQTINGGTYDLTWPTSGVFFIQNPS
jgi:hypothetical protein